MPTIGLILDHQIEEGLDPDQLSSLLPVFRDLTDSALPSGVNGPPTTQLHAVEDTALSIFDDPALLGADGQHLRLDLGTGLGLNWVVTGLAAG